MPESKVFLFGFSRIMKIVNSKKNQTLYDTPHGISQTIHDKKEKIRLPVWQAVQTEGQHPVSKPGPAHLLLINPDSCRGLIMGDPALHKEGTREKGAISWTEFSSGST